MLESTIVHKIITFLKSRGFFVFKTHGNGIQMSGLPDILACKDGRFIALEVKQPGKKPTKLQLHRIHQIIVAGGIAACVTSVEEVKEVLRDYVN
jgi:Holliday junction resolvase